MRLFTIGFAGFSAEDFFVKLSVAGVRKVVDVRLRNSTQLSAFAKKRDLAFFLRRLCEIEYLEAQELAPTKELLDGYRKGHLDWPGYEAKYGDLIRERQVEHIYSRGDFEDACLLCSEHAPVRCHRRVLAEYLASTWGDVTIAHLT